LRRLASSALMAPYGCRQRWKVFALRASFWQTCAMVLPAAKSTSAVRSLRMICIVDPENWTTR
jgi:hypothetical protein